MITKIFYSLVIFPEIQYGKSFNGAFLKSIKEIKLGELRLEFIYENKILFIDFIYKNNNDITESLYNTKNWIIKGDENVFLKKLYKTILTKDIFDFYFFEDKTYYNKIPFGVVLSITSKCNLECSYCFNDYDYDLSKRNKIENKTLSDWKIIIDKLYNSGTRVVILTGGEPFLFPDFFDLLDYLKSKNIYVHLNTNGTLLNKNILEKLNNFFSLNLMISIHEFSGESFAKVNFRGTEDNSKFYNIFNEKIYNIKNLIKYTNLSYEFITILNWNNVLNLETIYKWGVDNFDHHNWQFFRLYPTKNNKGASKLLLDIAIRNIYKLNSKYRVNYKIVDPVPFCVTKDLDKSKEVIDGVLSDSHDVKTIITPQGYIQLMSAYDNNFWHIDKDSMQEVFESEFTKKMLNNGFLPEECVDCVYKELCKGGSRMDANMEFGSYNKFDPVGDLKNKITA